MHNQDQPRIRVFSHLQEKLPLCVDAARPRTKPNEEGIGHMHRSEIQPCPVGVDADRIYGSKHYQFSAFIWTFWAPQT
jgi:hypothetical protein